MILDPEWVAAVNRAAAAEREADELRNTVTAYICHVHVLQRALEWALSEGAAFGSPGVILDGGCGCCTYPLTVPPEFAEVVRFAEAANEVRRAREAGDVPIR